MPSFQLQESNYSGPIPDDTILAAEVIGVKLEDKPYREDPNDPNSPNVKKVVFKFLITEEGPWENQNVWGETSTTFTMHPDCRLYGWSQEIMGTEFPPGYILDTDVLLSRPCRINVGQRSYQKNKGTDQEETKIVNFVKDVIRVSSMMPSQVF